MKNFESIDAQEAKILIDGARPLIVDIRDKSSFDEAHIDSAVHIDDTNVAEFIAGTDKQRPLICYCYHGISSQSAADYFTQQGFQKVYNINGGFEAWRIAYPSVSS